MVHFASTTQIKHCQSYYPSPLIRIRGFSVYIACRVLPRSDHEDIHGLWCIFHFIADQTRFRYLTLHCEVFRAGGSIVVLWSEGNFCRFFGRSHFLINNDRFCEQKEVKWKREQNRMDSSKLLMPGYQKLHWMFSLRRKCLQVTRVYYSIFLSSSTRTYFTHTHFNQCVHWKLKALKAILRFELWSTRRIFGTSEFRTFFDFWNKWKRPSVRPSAYLRSAVYTHMPLSL